MLNLDMKLYGTCGGLSENKTSWTQELNLVSWSGTEFKFDICDWIPDYEKMGKGISMIPVEFDEFEEYFGKIVI